MSHSTDGELWAAAELRRLRACRFMPSAWVRLISSSFSRAAQTRTTRQGLARQARRWCGIGAGAGVGLCAARPALRSRAPAFLGWWLGVSAMLDWHLGMVEGQSGEPRQQLSVAAALTLVRLWLVPFLAAAEQPASFTALILGAALTDTLDGPLARRLGPTRLGRDLDRTADVVVMLAAASATARGGWLARPVRRLLILRGSLPVAFVAGGYLIQAARPPAAELGSFRRFAPVLIAGLALAPGCPRCGNTLVTLAAGGPMAVAAIRFSSRPRRAAARVGPA